MYFLFLFYVSIPEDLNFVSNNCKDSNLCLFSRGLWWIMCKQIGMMYKLFMGLEILHQDG
jgi:hypothetical protein